MELQTMKIAFITAMPEEFRAVSRHLKTPFRGQFGRYKGCSGTVADHDVVVIESGIGFDNAARGTEALIREVRPDVLISAGFCGGIAPDLGVGAVVVATRLVIVSGDLADEVQVELAVAGNFVASQPTSVSHVFGGTFVSTPVIMTKTRIADLLPSGAPHPVVEMESGAVALIAAENGIPFVGIRSVSDPSGEEIGFSLNEFCDDQMRIRIPRVLLAIIRKPRIIPQLVRLARNSRIAAANLARAVEQLLNFV